MFKIFKPFAAHRLQGFNVGHPGNPVISCPRPAGEIFENRNFDCGTRFWTTNNYGGVLTDNGDGTITLTAEQNFSSIEQADKFPIPAGNYHVGAVITSITGKGKYSYRLGSNDWHNALTWDAPGTYEADITVDQPITAIQIGADDDATAVITFDGVACIDTAQIPMPDWYKIASLDPADILGVWDATWLGIGSTSDFLVNLDGSMPNMVIDSGSPSWNGHNVGFVFGGSGSIKSRLPDGIDMRDLTVVMEFHDVTRENASLDALYSHYLDDDNGHYTLQNAWNEDKIRWSCGDTGSGTVEPAGRRLEGVIVTSGRFLYHDGVLLGEVPDSGPTSSTSIDFRLGCIWVGSRTQYSKFKLKKLLLVKRQLTESEVQEITSNIQGAIVQTPDLDGDGNPDTHLLDLPGGGSVTEDSDSVNIDLDGDGVADIELEK